MAAYTSTQSGNFNAVATWGGGGWPSSAGDTYTVSVGHTVTVNGDFSGTNLGASTVNGTLRWATNANTALQVDGTVTGNSGGIVGNASAIGAAYTARLIWGGVDGGKLLWIKDGCKLLGLGNYAFNMQSEAFASCYTSLQAQAASGQPNISVPAAFANALRASGDVLCIQGTSSTNQDEIVTVLSKSGGTITLTGNLTNTHASGAVVTLLSRNFIICSASSAAQGIIDDDTNSTTTPGVDLKMTELRYIKYLDCLTIASVNYCVFRGSNSYSTLLRDGAQMTFTNNVIANSLYWGLWTKVKAENLILAKATNATGAFYQTSGPFTIDGGFLFGTGYVARANDGPVIFRNLDIRNVLILAYYLYAELGLEDCILSQVTYLTSYQKADAYLRNTTEPTTAMQVNTQTGVRVQSQDHNRVLGAAKTWVNGIGTIERQNSVARSGYAAECTPDTKCGSKLPLEIPFEIPCTHGDVITATVYVRVNATYGTTHDPTLVLDPENIYGCNATSTEDVTTADTWTQLTVTGTANLGGAGVKGVVNCVLRIPYYVSGGKVYVDDFEVTIA